MTPCLFRRVGVDLHVRDRYFIVGRAPLILLCLLALSIMVSAI